MNFKVKIETAEPVHIQVEKFFRREIQNGTLVNGQRIPPTQELAKMCGVNPVTLQKALERLEAAGLIERTPRRGTYVKAETEKAVIGLLMGINSLDETRYFQHALGNAVRTEIGRNGWSCRIYDRLDDPEHEGREETRQQLIRDIGNYGFKGLVFLSVQPAILKDAALRSDLPRVLADATFDRRDFVRSAVEFLAGKGRRRMTYLRSGLGYTRDVDEFMDAASDLGLKLTRESIRHVDIISGDTASMEQLGYVQMEQWMMRWDSVGEWPDGLIVSDDIIMRGVARALNEHQVKVPERILVMAATNEEIRHSYAVPVVRFEFSVKELARQMVAILQKRIFGESLPDLPILVKGRLREEELKPAQP